MPETKKKNKLKKIYLKRRAILATILIIICAGIFVIVKVPAENLDIFSKKPAEEPSQNDEVADTQAEDEQVESEPEVSQYETVYAVDNSDDEQDPNWATLLVSAKHPIDESFDVKLERIGENSYVDKRIAKNVIKMIADAKSCGINLQIFSAYRDPVAQEELYQQKIEEFMDAGLPLEEATRKTVGIVSEPWTSEHHTGLALDISNRDVGLSAELDKTAEYFWLAENAHEYGFILRYPKDKANITGITYEPWHFRYVGEEAAKSIYENKYTLEEYLYIKEKNENKEVLESLSDSDSSDGAEDGLDADTDSENPAISHDDTVSTTS